MVGQLGQGFGVRDTDTDRYTRAAEYLAADLAAETVQVIDAGEVGEGFVNLKERCQPMDIGLNEYFSGFRSGVRCP